MRSAPGIANRLQMLLFDSLVAGLRGSAVGTPSITNVYRYAPGGTGPRVMSQAPFSPFVKLPPDGTPGMSPAFSRTDSARGAEMRRVTRRSGNTSGEVTGRG